MKINEKPTIYGVKTGETIHYIGKTVREGSNGEITRSLISSRSKNERLNNLFKGDEEVVIEPIKVVESDEWYDEKLQEVVQKHAQHHPLVNAQWMLDGKRGYWEGTGGFWEGKTRDAHTLKRLSESKYTKICQYDNKGKLVKIWAGAKEAAIQVFGDYSLDNTHGKSDLYNSMRATTMRSSFKMGSYWFRVSDMKRHFGLVPTKLNLSVILDKEKMRRSERRTQGKPATHARRYTVIQYDSSGEEIERFDNSHHAAFELKMSLVLVQRICRGTAINSNYLLEFGPKVVQPINPDYGSYKFDYKKHVKPRKVEMISKTTTPVLHYKNDVLLRTYEDGVREAVKRLGFSEYKVRKLCRTRQVINNRRLEFGEKKTVLTPRFGIKPAK